MRTTRSTRIGDVDHPILAILTASGIGVLVLAGLLVVADTFGTMAAGSLGYRIGVLGYLLLAAGVAGYVAVAVFRRHPGS